MRSKEEKRVWLVKLLPYLKTTKERLALFTLALVMALAPLALVKLEQPHMHVESDNPTMLTVTSPSIYSNGITSAYPW